MSSLCHKWHRSQGFFLKNPKKLCTCAGAQKKQLHFWHSECQMWRMGAIGSTIRAKRDTLGITQATLAKKVGVGRRTLIRWEQERFLPRGKNLVMLASVLEIPVERLTSGLPPAVAEAARELTEAFIRSLPAAAARIEDALRAPAGACPAAAPPPPAREFSYGELPALQRQEAEQIVIALTRAAARMRAGTAARLAMYAAARWIVARAGLRPPAPPPDTALADTGPCAPASASGQSPARSGHRRRHGIRF